jgi:hypothetical protein
VNLVHLLHATKKLQGKERGEKRRSPSIEWMGLPSLVWREVGGGVGGSRWSWRKKQQSSWCRRADGEEKEVGDGGGDYHCHCY